jgi:hypothetical protein
MKTNKTYELHKMDRSSGDPYITAKRQFLPNISLKKSEVKKILNFAWEMTWGQFGEHRPNRSGGSQYRNNAMRFKDVVEGKCGEFAVRKFLVEKGHKPGEVDLAVYSRGVWDDVDLTLNGKAINVKTMKHFSNLLLLEHKDYSEDGNYLGHTDSSKRYDIFFCARMRSSIQEYFRSEGLNGRSFSSFKEFESHFNALSRMNWELDLPGFVPLDLLKQAIQEKHIIARGECLNGRTRMDATNIYIQSGDFLDVGLINDFVV